MQGSSRFDVAYIVLFQYPIFWLRLEYDSEKSESKKMQCY